MPHEREADAQFQQELPYVAQQPLFEFALVGVVGQGQEIEVVGVFQDLLRSDAIDVVRPNLALHGITQSRRIAAVAEPYYVAAAPFHNGGPIAPSWASCLRSPTFQVLTPSSSAFIAPDKVS